MDADMTDTYTTLAKIVHGSTLFGLRTSDSDRDFISIVMPSVEDIVTAGRGKVSFDGSTNPGATPNDKHDVDDKQIPLAMFVDGLGAGLLDCIELVNAPREFHMFEPHPIFVELQAEAWRLTSRKIDKIKGFAHSLANRYSPRVDRMEAAQAAYDALARFQKDSGPKARIAPAIAAVVAAASSPYVFSHDIQGEGGAQEHLEVCGRNITSTMTVATALGIVGSVLDKYGKRVRGLSAMQDEDWKALSHATRAVFEGREYIRTGKLVLPLADAPHLLDIKLGRVPLAEVTDAIEAGIEAMVREAASSGLPEEPDLEFGRRFVFDAHYAWVAEAAQRMPARRFGA
jgi:hypothetical protein